MSIDHNTLVWFSKSFGLFYLIALCVAVIAYTWWPSNRTRFENAARSVLRREDEPWR
jgi:cytochrome c oxidase cbb3-type subunit 4